MTQIDKRSEIDHSFSLSGITSMGPIAAEIGLIGQLRDRRTDRGQVRVGFLLCFLLNVSFRHSGCDAVTPGQCVPFDEEKLTAHVLTYEKTNFLSSLTIVGLIILHIPLIAPGMLP